MTVATIQFFQWRAYETRAKYHEIAHYILSAILRFWSTFQTRTTEKPASVRSNELIVAHKRYESGLVLDPGGEDVRRGGVAIVARFSAQVETSFMLSARPPASLSFFSSSLIFALNISQRTGSGRVTYCSSSTLSQWRRRRFSHSLIHSPPPPRHFHQRREERREENVANRARNRKVALRNRTAKRTRSTTLQFQRRGS